jgi:hypothetical protein
MLTLRVGVDKSFILLLLLPPLPPPPSSAALMVATEPNRKRATLILDVRELDVMIMKCMFINQLESFLMLCIGVFDLWQ